MSNKCCLRFLLSLILTLTFFAGFEGTRNAGLAAAENGDAAESKESADSDKPKAFDKVVPNADKVPGLITMFRKKENLYAEIGSAQLGKDYIVVVSIAKGIGNTLLYAGQSYLDMVWQFKKVDDRIQIVRRNYRYQADSGTTEEKSLSLTYTDSILFSIPIIAAGPSGGDIVDLTSIFMSDLPGIARSELSGFSFAKDRSSWEKVKGFSDNVELEIAATYSSSSDSESFNGLVLDSRGLTVNVHYSISMLNDTGYKPRQADERVGYFTTAIKNLNKNPDDGNFVRYINRWNLQKLEPDADVSLPKKPIVFWLDKTMPFQYRKPVRDGILEWNKAFEEAGFYNAIEVRQQEENDTWDPEDIHYNTIRWSSAGLGFSIGPSRVNPMTGEILDADVVLDVGFIKSWNSEFELYAPAEMAKLFCGKSDLIERIKNPANEEEAQEIIAQADRKNLQYFNETLFYSQQLGLATTYFDVMEQAASETETAGNAESPDTQNDENSSETKEEEKQTEPKICPKCGKPIKPETAKKEETKKDADEEKAEETAESGDRKEETEYCSCEKPNYETERKKLIAQGLKWMTAHEVGHTLGLRHSFKQSTLHTFDEINSMTADSKYGYGGSVMEYMPANIMPEGEKQGDYYPAPLGAYDYWVIKYGYKVFPSGKEVEELKSLASEQTKKEYDYATDEECYFNGDPLVNVFDLGDPLEYAKLRVRLFNQILPGLNGRIVKDGESYAKLRSRFSALFSDYGRAIYLASRFVGGLEVHRDFKGDKDARPTFVPTPVEKQREALQFVIGELFSAEQRKFSPDLFNHLAPNRWLHWGVNPPFSRYDVRVENLIGIWQQVVLDEVLSDEKMGRIIDTQYRVEAGTDILTLAELFDTLTDSIFAELDREPAEYTPANPAVNSIRRNLQRDFVEKLSARALHQSLLGSLLGEEEENDIASLARYELQKVAGKIDKTLESGGKLDTYSAAHLSELKARIAKTLDASVMKLM